MINPFILAIMLLAAGGAEAMPTNPPIRPEWPPRHPVVACSSGELARLRSAYRGGGPSRAPVAALVLAAEEALAKPVAFPPRGGQHNQWYQCDRCQTALSATDAGHHRCPACGHVYSGPPYDDVVFGLVHEDNLKRLLAAAWAYAVTEDLRFADFARLILLGYADRYRAFPYHASSNRPDATPVNSPSGGYLFEQTLNEAVALSSRIAPAYDLIHDAPGLTADDHDRIRDGLLRPMLENLDKHKGGKSNWQTWHNAGMLWGGAVLRDAGWVDKALCQPDNGFYSQMVVSVTDDGMWYENSWGYHFYTLTALVRIAEGARRLGLDLWPEPRFKAMFTLPARYVMPDGSLPRFGDDVNTRLTGFPRLFELAYQAYGDDSLLPFLSDTPSLESVLAGRACGPVGALPEPESGVFRGAGHAILRARGEKGLATVLSFGPYGGFHGHFDKLSFVFYGCGRELGVDPGRAASQAYRLPIHGNWYKATLSHNAVVVDGQSQKGVEGALEFFSTNGIAAAVARCDDAYPGVRHQRLLLLMPDYLLVFDRLDSDREHRYDWLYHSRGGEAFSDLVLTGATDTAAFPGGDYIARPKSGATDGGVRIGFPGDGVTTFLTMDAAPGTGVLLGDGPGASVADRVPLAMVTRLGKGARFAAVLEPVKDGLSDVTAVRMAEQAGVIRLEVLKGGRTDVFLLDGDGRLSAPQGAGGPELQPFWTGGRVYRESVFFVRNGAGVAAAPLIFNPTAIEKVESATGETVYEEGRDYTLSEGRLVLPAGSAIPCAAEAELHPPPATPGLPAYIRLRGHPDTGMLFGEGAFFHKRQVCVTYRHRDDWKGPVPGLGGGSLPRTLARLKAKGALVLGVSGDSISAGGNASKFTKAPPFQPAFPELVAGGLGARFGAGVVLKNRAVGGWTSKAGLADAGKLAEERPDLVIIAYGMNDDLQFEPAVFAANIRGIMDVVRTVNPEAEFILVAGMCGNDDWAPIRPERFPAFRDALKAMEGEGVAVADVTSVWLELMKRKRFLDLTGNGVNHPNDFSHRVYAQEILALFQNKESQTR